MSTTPNKLTPCLVPGCRRTVCEEVRAYRHQGARGLCRCHYLCARRLVRRGETSWDRLEAAGRAVPSKVGERDVEARAYFLAPVVGR